MKRRGNDPTRRLAPPDRLAPNDREKLARSLIYVGSALHKRRPGDYGFQPPCNPRPTKSVCDGVRPVLRAEATALFRAGLTKGMVSDEPEANGPKYIWAVDEAGEVYEAKIGNGGYHGYRLEAADSMRAVVKREWARR